ncbi:MAG: hypothetical protein ACREEP_21160 [Dongiaceae bacterium]
MRSFLVAAILAVAAVAAPAAAEEVPCEKMLEDLRAAVKSATLNDADAAKVKELEDKGVERCNADDDAHADEFFAQAMKVLGK